MPAADVADDLGFQPVGQDAGDDLGFVPVTQHPGDDLGFIPQGQIPKPAPSLTPASDAVVAKTPAMIGADYGSSGPSVSEAVGMEKAFAAAHPSLYGVARGVAGMIPTPEQVIQAGEEVNKASEHPIESLAALPGDIVNNATEMGKAARGDYGPEAQAQTITGAALMAAPLLHLPFAKGVDLAREAPPVQMRAVEPAEAMRPPPETPTAAAAEPTIVAKPAPAPAAAEQPPSVAEPVTQPVFARPEQVASAVGERGFDKPMTDAEIAAAQKQLDSEISVWDDKADKVGGLEKLSDAEYNQRSVLESLSTVLDTKKEINAIPAMSNEAVVDALERESSVRSGKTIGGAYVRALSDEAGRRGIWDLYAKRHPQSAEVIAEQRAPPRVAEPPQGGDVWYHAGTGEGTPVYLTRDKAWAEAWAKEHGTPVKAFKVKGNIRQLAEGEPDALIWNSPYSQTFRDRLSGEGYVGIAESGPNAQLAVTDLSALTEIKQPRVAEPPLGGEREPPVPPPQEPAKPPPSGVPQGETPSLPPGQTGASAKSFEEVYGKGEIPTGQSVLPEEIYAQGAADLANGADVYAYADRARTGNVTPRELGQLAAEHNRLVTEAAALEGSPAYEPAYQRARAFAENMLKPAGTRWHQTGMGLQVKAPIDYSNLTGFRQAVEENMKREMTPSETRNFKQAARDVNKAKTAAAAEGPRTGRRIAERYRGVKDISFDDAVAQMRDAIQKGVTECGL